MESKKAAIWRTVLILEDRRLKIFCEHGNLPIRSFPNGVKNYLKIQDLLVSIVLSPFLLYEIFGGLYWMFWKAALEKKARKYPVFHESQCAIFDAPCDQDLWYGIDHNLLTLPTLVTYQNNKKRPPSCFFVVVGLYCCFTLMVSMSQTSLFRRRKWIEWRRRQRSFKGQFFSAI